MPQTIARDLGQRESLRVHAADNVRVALRDLPAGREVDDGGKRIVLSEPIRQKHKFNLASLAEGDTVIMYGVTVGRATRPIPAGAAITTENTEHSTASAAPGARRGHWQAPDVSAFQGATFDGYHRPDGRVGTANLWLVVPLVFCENRNIEVLRQSVADALGEASRVERAPAPLSELSIGVECGGSDGFSGLSANPVVGGVIDRLVALGGSGILSGALRRGARAAGALPG